jgi:3-phenylpropionate/trans-cinnamate dioxygenase ferredoxin subunit
MHSFNVGGCEVVIARVGESFYAFPDECTHLQQYLSDGWLQGHEVICAYHEATYDLKTGRVVYGPAFDDLQMYGLRVEGDDLLLEWPREVPSEDVYPVDHGGDDERLQRQIMM